MIEDEIFVFWSLVGFHRLVAWSKHCNKAEKTDLFRNVENVAKNPKILKYKKKVFRMNITVRDKPVEVDFVKTFYAR